MIEPVVKRPRGRPPKYPRPVEVVASNAETPATVVRPVADPDEDTNPIEVSDATFVEVEGVPVVHEPDDAGEDVAGLFRDSGVADRSAVVEGGVVGERSAPPLTPQQTVALDRDYDGNAGGSRPAAKLTDHQRAAFMRDVVDAYEGQVEIKRTDAFNRVWTFRHEIVKNMDHMLVEARRGPTVAQRLISTAVFSQGRALSAVEDVDGETAR